MISIEVGKLKFTFPKGWQASQFDDWSFYRKQFIGIAEARIPCSKCQKELACAKCGNRRIAGTKAIDILAIEGNSCCWCIEIKDYRFDQRAKTIDLADEVALKVRDSLAALVVARLNASDREQKELAIAALRCPRLKIVLHLEQPIKPSKLFPRVIDPAKVQQRLKQLIKAIDPHPLVVEINRMHGLGWSVK